MKIDTSQKYFLNDWAKYKIVDYKILQSIDIENKRQTQYYEDITKL